MGAEHPAPHIVALNAAEGVAAAAEPVAAVLVIVVPTSSGTSNPDSAAVDAEQEHALAALVMFKSLAYLRLTGKRWSHQRWSHGSTRWSRSSRIYVPW